MAVTETEITSWKNDYVSNGTPGTNVPGAGDVIDVDLGPDFQSIKSIARKESVNKFWERWKGLYGTLAYVSASQFTLTGDQRVSNGGPVALNRKVKTTNTGGTVYGTISVVSFGGGLTTVTINTGGSGSMDSGLSEVQFGIYPLAGSGGQPVLPADMLSVNRVSNAGTASGTNTYALTVGNEAVITAYIDGQQFVVKFTNANTVTTPTLNIASLGAVTITKASGALAVGDLKAGKWYLLVYNLAGPNFQVVGIA